VGLSAQLYDEQAARERVALAPALTNEMPPRRPLQTGYRFELEDLKSASTMRHRCCTKSPLSES